MNQEGVKVLLLSKRPGGLLSLLRRLEQRGCRCWCATSSEEGLSLFDAHNFDLILSAGPLHQASPMITRLVESHCSVFYSYPVENGWWWIPLVDCQGLISLDTDSERVLRD